MSCLPLGPETITPRTGSAQHQLGVVRLGYSKPGPGSLQRNLSQSFYWSIKTLIVSRLPGLGSVTVLAIITWMLDVSTRADGAFFYIIVPSNITSSIIIVAKQREHTYQLKFYTFATWRTYIRALPYYSLAGKLRDLKARVGKVQMKMFSFHP